MLRMKINHNDHLFFMKNNNQQKDSGSVANIL